MSTVRPPLPPPLSHEGITFILGDPSSKEISSETLTTIAAILSAGLPPGDFDVTPDGKLVFAKGESASPWITAGRLEGVDRGVR